MASAELSRRVERVVGYPPLVEMDDQQRREFHEALLGAESFEDLPGKCQAAILEAEAARPQLRASVASSEAGCRAPSARIGAPSARLQQCGPCHSARPTQAGRVYSAQDSTEERPWTRTSHSRSPSLPCSPGSYTASSPSGAAAPPNTPTSTPT